MQDVLELPPLPLIFMDPTNVKERGTCVSNEEGEVIKPEMIAKEVNS